MVAGLHLEALVKPNAHVLQPLPALVVTFRETLLTQESSCLRFYLYNGQSMQLAFRILESFLHLNLKIIITSGTTNIILFLLIFHYSTKCSMLKCKYLIKVICDESTHQTTVLCHHSKQQTPQNLPLGPRGRDVHPLLCSIVINKEVF